jgi:hypothetical protein
MVRFQRRGLSKCRRCAEAFREFSPSASCEQWPYSRCAGESRRYRSLCPDHTSSCDLYPLAVLRRPLRLLSAVLRELNGEIASGEVEFELGDNTQPKLPHSLEFCVAFRPHASIIRRTRYHTDGGIESSRQQAWVKHWRVQLATTAESQRGPKARTSFCGLESRQRSL